MLEEEFQYLKLVQRIMSYGTDCEDRTGVGTRAIIGTQMRFDLGKGFPLMTTKRTHFKSIVYELLWFIRGDTNVKYLNEHGVKIWDEWADEEGDLGPVYGAQWRKWHEELCGDVWEHDQLGDVIKSIKNNPGSRRHIVSSWNVAELSEMALPPCHCLFQFFVHNGKLSCQLYQRSVDTFLGLPFNIASYALLTLMVAQVCDLELGEFIHVGGDVHLYQNHFEQALKLVDREPYPWPQVKLNPEIKNIDDFRYEDIKLENYQYHPGIKAPVAV